MKKSTISAIAAVSVSGALVVGLGAVSSWFTNWNVKTWFGRGGGNSTVQPIQPDMPDTPDKPITGDNASKDGAVVSNVECNGIQLLSAKLPVAAYAANGVSEQADTAYTIAATIEPAETTNKAVDWNIAWANADSAWASGKTVTDYVTVTPSANGSLTAVVECKQAFGEQVIVTCTSRDNTELTAVCTVDYMKRITSLNMSVQAVFDENNNYCGSVSAAVPKFSGNSPSGGKLYNNYRYVFRVAPELTVGTLNDTYVYSFYSTMTDYAKNYFSVSSPTMLPCSVTDINAQTGAGNVEITINESYINNVFGKGMYKSSGFYGFIGNGGAIGSGAIKYIIQCGGSYSSYDVSYVAAFEQSTFTVSASSIAVDNSSIIF